MFGKKEEKVGAYIDTPVVVITGPYAGMHGRITRVYDHFFWNEYSVEFNHTLEEFPLWMLRTPDGKKLRAV